MEPGTGERSVSFAHGDAVAGRSGCDGRDAVDHGHFWNGSLLGQQASARVGDSYGPRRANQGSATGSVGPSSQIVGVGFGCRIVARNFGEPGVGFHRVSGNSTRSAGTGRRCSDNVTAGSACYVDSSAPRAVD